MSTKTVHTVNHECISHELHDLNFEFINLWNMICTAEQTETPYTRNWKCTFFFMRCIDMNYDYGTNM